jgi:hypothetical protein
MNFTDLRNQLACTGRANEMVVDSYRPQHQQIRQTRKAIAICTTCPLLDRCRAWVLGKDDDPCPQMVVGGMSPAERRRRRWGNEACGTDAGYQRHQRAGETPCQPCIDAHGTKTREWAANYRARQRQGGAA